MTFEFDIEVRPEFDLPKWKGLKIERPMREFTRQGRRHAGSSRFWLATAAWCRTTAPPQSGDYITCNLTFKNGDESSSPAARKK